MYYSPLHIVNAKMYLKCELQRDFNGLKYKKRNKNGVVNSFLSQFTEFTSLFENPFIVYGAISNGRDSTQIGKEKIWSKSISAYILTSAHNISAAYLFFHLRMFIHSTSTQLFSIFFFSWMCALKEQQQPPTNDQPNTKTLNKCIFVPKTKPKQINTEFSIPKKKQIPICSSCSCCQRDSRQHRHYRMISS